MQRLTRGFKKVFVYASGYLLALLLLFASTSIFDIEEFHFPAAVEWFFKITIGLAAASVIISGTALPIIKLLGRKSVFLKQDPVLAAAKVFLIGLGLIFLQALYVRLRSCAVGDTAWHCHVDGKSYVGLLILLFLISICIGLVAWAVKKLKKKA